MKSPLAVTYNDLIEATEKRLNWMEKAYPIKVISNEMSQWAATHGIETQRRLLKLLRKFKREKQLDLFQAFEKLK